MRSVTLEPLAHKTDTVKASILLCGIIIANIITYLYFRFDFVSWDHYFILNLRSVHSLHDFLRLLLPSDVHPGTGWRPLYWFLMGIPYFLGGGSAFAFQLAKIIVHSINISLVFWLALILSKNKATGIIAAIIFAFHPALPEAVAIFCEIDDMTMAMCIMLSLILYIKFNREHAKKLLVLSWLSFTAAQFIREPAVIAPFILIAYDVSHGNKIGKKIKTYFLYLAVSIAYFTIRSLALRSQKQVEIGWFSRFSLKHALTSIVYYARDLVIPIDFSVLKPFLKTHQLFGPLALLGGLLLGIFLLYIAFRKHREFIFLILFISISLGISIIVPLSISRRYLYLPACGFSILMVMFLFQLFSATKYKKVLLSFIFLCYIASQIVTLFERNTLYAYTGNVVKESLVNLQKELPSVETNAVVALVGVPGFCENTHCFYLAADWKIRYLYDNKDLEVLMISYLSFNHKKFPHHILQVRPGGVLYEEIESSANEYINLESQDLFKAQILKRGSFGEISRVTFTLNEDSFENKKIYLVGMKENKLSLLARRSEFGQWETVK